MRTLYESILDTDKESAEKTGDVTFFLYFAECFVKTFGKLDRKYYSLDRRFGAPKRIGRLETNDWTSSHVEDNEFITRLHDMVKLLKKEYPKLKFSVDHKTSSVVQSVWKVQYTIHFKLQEYEFDWIVDVVIENDKIKFVVVYDLHTRATKNQELLKIIDDNI